MPRKCGYLLSGIFLGLFSTLSKAEEVVPISAKTVYVSPVSASDGPGDAWSNAFHSIQSAVDAAVDGDTVLVTNGTYATGGRITPGYACMNRVVVTKDIVLQSVNGPEVTIIEGAEATGGGNGPDAVRGVYMSAGQLSGFTVCNGHTMISGDAPFNCSGGGINMYGGTGVVSNCTIRGNMALCGGGSTAGTLNNCTLNGNMAGYGGGSYHGRLNNCTLYENTASNCGGGSYHGRLKCCTVYENTASNGGGSYSGILNNCTLSGNSAEIDGGGACDGTLYNCIVYFNSALKSGDNWYRCSFSYSCTTPMPAGEGNITNEPVLVSALCISPDSPCVGAGSSSYASAADIHGDAWQTPPSIGCDEPLSAQSGGLRLSIAAKGVELSTGYLLNLMAEIDGVVTSNSWSFGDGTLLDNTVYAQHAWSYPGSYDVVLTVYNDDHSEGVSTIQTVQVLSEQAAAMYVSASSGSDANDGLSWATAKQTIQAGVDAQVALGGTVWITNGNYTTGGRVTPGYACMNRVVVTKDIVLQSVNGPKVTTIEGAESTGGGNGADAVRGVYMLAGKLRGFTIRNGHTMVSGDLRSDRSGGGINLFGGAGVVSNCLLIGNTAEVQGGGSCFGTLNDCSLHGNTAYSGGGSCFGTLNDCTLYGNSAEGSGGGSFCGLVVNCLFVGNTAEYCGGGADRCEAFNCTFTGNSADYAGGTYSTRLYNCIAWFNSAEDREQNVRKGRYGAAFFTCSTDVEHGVDGCITNAPGFLDAENFDYNLHSASPCIDAGSNEYAPEGNDLNGEDRIIDGDLDGTVTVDMGCYEFVHAGDADRDSMRDSWERAHGLLPGADDRALDPDSDGFDNLAEYIADTHPGISGDYLSITSMDAETGTVYFNSSRERVYSLLSCTNLVEGVWVEDTSPTLGAGGADSLSSEDTEPFKFYQIKVAVP